VRRRSPQRDGLTPAVKEGSTGSWVLGACVPVSLEEATPKSELPQSPPPPLLTHSSSGSVTMLSLEEVPGGRVWVRSGVQ
jgi:hypothetical protein